MTTIDPPLSAALSTDYFFLREQLTEEQLGVLRTTRAFVDDEVLPSINTYCERAELPWPLIRRMGEQQFGKPLASFQLIHDRLVKMLVEVTGMQRYCLQLGRLAERGRLTDTIAGLAKLNNTRKARQVIADARDMLARSGLARARERRTDARWQRLMRRQLRA